MFTSRPWHELQEHVDEQNRIQNLTSQYMDWSELPTTLKPGDLIEFNGCSSSSGGSISGSATTHKRWSVYQGVREGVHYVYTSKNGNGKEEVKCEPLEYAAEGTKGRKNNLWDEKWDPLPQDQLLKRAQDQLPSLDLTSNEHFALECRYGEQWARPVMVAPQFSLLQTMGEGVVVIVGIPVYISIVGLMVGVNCILTKMDKLRKGKVTEDK